MVGWYLVLVPIGLLGAVLCRVVGALADEALLPGPHPGNPQRVLRPPRSSYSAAGSRLLHLLEHALLLFGAVGRRSGRGRTEAGVRLAEALARLPLTLVRHRLLRPPHSLALLFAAAVAAAGEGGRGAWDGERTTASGDKGFVLGASRFVFTRRWVLNF